MKKLSPSTTQHLKNAGWLIVYLIFFAIVPYLKLRSFVSNLPCSQPDAEKHNVRIFAYIFLASMILSFIPYKLSKFSSRTEKIIFIIIGLLIPFLGICLAFISSGLVCSEWIL
jgi:predicted lysophospholipase L1 biosynthesis ABC-type transport system permease subunit